MELRGIHVGDMLIGRTVTMIVLNDPIKEVLKGGVGVFGASIDADTRVEVLTSREDASLEGYSSRIGLIMVFVPDIFGKVLAEERCRAFGELWPVNKIIRTLQVISAHSPLSKTSSRSSLNIIVRVITAHCVVYFF